jgi:ADP-dependent NAD(P)H-hydrate dehydratase / NAD(P)H-hydrate epimerase
VLILSAEQIKAWDEFTIEQEPVSSIDLMERAAQQCVNWLEAKKLPGARYYIFCGKGNNGGDGLAVARLLVQSGHPVSVHILEFGKAGSQDFQINLQRLQEMTGADLHFIQSSRNLPALSSDDIIIDALFGSGLNKPLEGLAAEVVLHINNSKALVVSIDLPSGLFIDRSSQGNVIIRANYTLSFQCYKVGLLLQENASYIGEVTILDIGLQKKFLEDIRSSFQLLDERMIRNVFKPRNRFAHKGTFGHALILGGSYGKMGAAVLATRACISSGAGLTTAFIPKCGYQVMQASLPEAMVIIDEKEDYLSNLPDDIERFTSIGIGPGIGIKSETQNLLSYILRRYQRPLVIDADGLNCLAANKEWLASVPPYSILTPHPKEFDRLFGDHLNDFDRLTTAKAKSAALKVIIVLKSHHSFISLPGGQCYFNSTGNAGMAKGGSGDILTGIITALLAQGYQPQEAAVLGVYLHGWSGDFAAKKFSLEAMLPSHTIDCLSDVFLALQA